MSNSKENDTIRSRRVANFRLAESTRERLREMAADSGLSQRKFVEELILTAHQKAAA